MSLYENVHFGKFLVKSMSQKERTHSNALPLIRITSFVSMYPVWEHVGGGRVKIVAHDKWSFINTFEYFLGKKNI